MPMSRDQICNLMHFLHQCKIGSSLGRVCVQVRSFGKEGAACERYHGAVLRTQSWGLKSAAAGGLFTAFNGTVAPGQLRMSATLRFSSCNWIEVPHIDLQAQWHIEFL